MCSIIFLVKILFLLCFMIFCVQYWMQNKAYLSDHDEIAEIARKYTVTNDIKDAYKKIYQEIKTRYPGHILPEEDTEWLFMNAGGWMGSMCLLYASLTEYILFFGTAIDTSGNSGRYWANISDTILTGSFLQWKEGELNSTMFKPGATVFHEWGEVTAVQWEGGTWMVEYARGFIPSTLGFALADTLFSATVFHEWGEVTAVQWEGGTWMVEYARGFIPSTLGFALADTLFSTTDFVTLFKILRVYCKALILETSTSLMELKEYIKKSL